MEDLTSKINCGILTFDQFHGRKKNTGSSRIRGEWLLKYWPEAEYFIQGKSYKSVIYQKAYFTDHAKAFNYCLDSDGSYKKPVKILDITDPDYLWWQGRVIEMANECDAITTSTEALVDDFRNFFPNKRVKWIKDRMDLEFHNEKKVHVGDARRVVWFGYSSNFEMLLPVLTFLEKLGLTLIVISDRPFTAPSHYDINIENYQWDIETVNRDIIKGDIAINPQSKSGKWRYKSENKTITANLLGVPVAKDLADLKRLIDCDERIKDAEESRKIAIEQYDVRQSVSEYKALIDEIYLEKNS